MKYCYLLERWDDWVDRYKEVDCFHSENEASRAFEEYKSQYPERDIRLIHVLKEH